jgi:hypothetical protein
MPAGKHIEPDEAAMIRSYLEDTSVSRDKLT